MTNTSLHYKQLIKQYDQKRTLYAHQKREREQTIYKAIPDIYKIDTSLSQIGIRLIKASLNSAQGEWLDAYKNKTEELIRLKKQLLVEHGYPVDYLEHHYDCTLCQDTGFLTDSDTLKTTTCKCFEQGLIDLAYNDSNLKHVLERENFSTFRLDVYSEAIHPVYGISPRTKMQAIYEVALGFTEQFATTKKSLLFHGPTGLGKTFLCNCIAKSILDQGYSVLYLTAQELFKLFEESRFHREDMEDHAKAILDTLFSVDLLVIDDFGTEVQNTFTAPDLFHVINTRHLHEKSTIISTNLPVKELKELYSDRIISRLFGNYTVCRFFGDDIRLMRLKK